MDDLFSNLSKDERFETGSIEILFETFVANRLYTGWSVKETSSIYTFCNLLKERNRETNMAGYYK